MRWFRRKPNIQAHLEAQHDNRVEVVVHKNATADAIKEAKETNEHLHNLLVENGFTLKIYLAAGGHAPKEGD